MMHTLLRLLPAIFAVAMALCAGCGDRSAEEKGAPAKSQLTQPAAAGKNDSGPTATASPNRGVANSQSSEAARTDQPLASGKVDAEKSF
jgi:hypothetical protein